ncbi:ParB/RepB/Spo0J family partition protein [Candidatus Kaiserbacteria bacterium]|nr:ParB/RepB/Spo0J family partition protein [Candidatus Kaiserbacteria bacterium]
MNKSEYSYKLIPLSQIHQDNEQPRKDVEDVDARVKLKASIEKYGIAIPLAVCRISDDEYRIMDGHRRYLCAQDLGTEVLPCLVYSKMPEGELESRRYEMQNNRKPWMPLEKSNALARIKDVMGFRRNSELAEHLHMSETLVANSLQLRNESMGYLGLMHKYDLKESYMNEFMRLKPKIRKVKNLEPNQIIIRIFEKVKNDVITTSREFRKIGRVFKRATINEKELHRFLENPDMTVEELNARTVLTGFAYLIEQLTQDIKSRLKEGETVTEQEIPLLKDLSMLISKLI